MIYGKLKNGNKEYKIGLLTVDEAVFAGGRYYASDGSANNTTFYLYTEEHYWMLSPSGFYIDHRLARVWFINGAGYIYDNFVSNSNFVRPSIALPSTTTISKGTGTVSDPYIID